MWNEKNQAQSSGAVQDDVVVPRRIQTARSNATTQHHTSQFNATTQDEYTQVQYWDDDEEPIASRSYLMRQLSIRMPYWGIVLQFFALAMFTVHMILCHGWPWQPPKPSFAIQSMQLTKTADKTCIEFKGVSTVCWSALKPGTWKIDPASGQITITELH